MPQLRVTIEQNGLSASKGSARGHTVLIDRPEDKGGANLGPMGGELFLMGLGGCYMSNLLAAIRARSSTVSDVTVEVSAQVDGQPPKFVAFTLSVSAKYDDRKEIEKLALIAERGCIVANSLRAHLPLEVVVR